MLAAASWNDCRTAHCRLYYSFMEQAIGRSSRLCSAYASEAVVDLQLAARAGRTCTVVRVGGELDMDTVPQLQDVLREVADDGAQQVVLDFADVTFMDSSGLGLLVDWYKMLRERDGRLCLAAVQQPVRTVLVLSAVDQVVEVYDTVTAAEADMPPAA
jgi:anti-sigma B factor antagonist